MLTRFSVILWGKTTGVLVPSLIISTCSICLSLLIISSKISSLTNNASPPDKSTSLTSGWFLIYSIALFILSFGIALSWCPANLLLVQCLQYIEHISVIRNNTLSGYLWVSPGTGESVSSANGSSISYLPTCISCTDGTACNLIGHLGFSGSIKHK